MSVEVSTADVRRLREETGAGIMDCKRALEQAQGDFEKAKEVLRHQGLATAAKKAERATAQGLIEAYIHGGGRIGVLIEVNCETDFVARTEQFRNLARELAMQVAAMVPQTVEELLDQPYIRNPSQTVRDLVTQTIAATGENIRVRRFARFQLGEE
jgi:elongation factor Ts